MASFADHFSELAARYAAYRPHYPPELITLLADHSERHEVAWDVGCGSGQLSVALATRFSRVIATDPAQAQLDHAERDPRVEYRLAPAEASGLPDASCDLAVAAQAAHWFDWPRFVVEVGRVVRPGGLIALISYRNADLGGDVGTLLLEYYQEIEPYWPNGRVHVNNHYRDLVLPWPAVTAPPLEITARWTRDELMGYITTWSATARLVAARGEAPVDALRRRLAAIWPDHELREVHWPLTIKLARR
ncbi:MAG TPA: class I SAM-dependent methyltransferase [Kofleriaceae bacterium]|jgi:SAM-dependent methyltransferase|nr:class I SAM-dependent methyltransferase [Kofleriaceae bacterium]